MSGDGTIKIFAGSASKEFAAQMCDYLGSPMGKCTTHIFSEGNTFVRIDESIRDKDVYFVQTLGLDPNNEFTELLFFLDAFKRASANSVTAIIPYFSYAKGDKKDEPRVSIRGRVCAECIELAGAVAIGDKTRTGHDENAKVLEIIGDVKGKNCIVVDDFTISGGTLVDVAHGLKDKGANDIYAFLSHVVLREKGVKKIEESPIKLLVSTDTVNCPAVKGHDKIKILSAAPMFAEAVRHIHDRMSMSNLFDNPSQRMLTMSFAKQMSLDDMMNLHK